MNLPCEFNNIIENKTKHIHVIYILHFTVDISICIPYTCIVSQRRRIQNPFKHLRWVVSLCHFKLLTDYAKHCVLNVWRNSEDRWVVSSCHFKLLTDYAKQCVLNFWRGSEDNCVQIGPANVLCHYNENLMEYFKFLYGLRIIILIINIAEKLQWQHLFKMLGQAGTHRLHLY